ncbi:MAG: glycosyltransferase [bacterium]|nr:glycosyltransferase [bacterium]
MSKKILLISNDVVGETMAGPGIRYTELARELGKEHQVLLAAPAPSTTPDPDIKLITYAHGDWSSLVPQVSRSEVIVAQSLHPTLLKAVRGSGARYIADLYDPIVLENLEAQKVLDLNVQSAHNRFFLSIANAQLALADHILCASDRQRDYWLGNLTALGRLTPDLYRDDPSLTSLISLLPFGYANQNPKITAPDALELFIPHFNPKKDHVIIWGGGVWNWFDPLTLIKAIHQIGKKRNDIKLLFLGTKHPNPHTPEMKMITKAHALAEELRLKDSLVFFNEGWVPYDQLANFLAPASIGASLHFDHAETRMSFRTRILSYIWAGLPILATRGDALSDFVEREGLGLTVDYQDEVGVQKAIVQLVDDADLRRSIKENMARVWPIFTWDRLIKPLSARIEQDAFANQRVNQYDYWRLVSQYYLAGANKVRSTKGLGGIIGKLKRKP